MPLHRLVRHAQVAEDGLVEAVLAEQKKLLDKIERLRAENASLLTNWVQSLEEGNFGRSKLVEAQAREAKLRAALNNIAWLRHPSERSSILVEKLERFALDALALPHDDSALKECLAQERERYEGWRDAVAFYVHDHCVDGETHAEIIRMMGESCS